VKRFLLLALPVALLFARLASAAYGDEPRPNVLLIFTDDQGWADLGVQGAVGFSTPNLDRLASEGTRLTSFYVAMPVCTPSRAGLLTGRHPMRLDLGRRVLFPFSNLGLAPDEETLAESLRNAGHATAIFGKWHLGHLPEYLPTRQGFDRFFGIPYSNDMDGHHYRDHNFKAPPLPLYSDEEVIEEAPSQAAFTRRFTDAAIEFIEENAARPWFAYLPHPMPHQPIHASEPFVGRTEAGLYGDVIEELDHHVGRLLDTLDRLSLAERTIVIFASDNGPWRRESAGPLRGKKNTTWEGGFRVPSLWRWPGQIPANRVSDAPITALDVMPTLEAFCDFVPNARRLLDGRDVSGFLRGGPAPAPDPFPFYREGKLQAVREGRFKLRLGSPPQLFDLIADRGETTDVAADHPEIVAELSTRAAAFRADLGG